MPGRRTGFLHSLLPLFCIVWLLGRAGARNFVCRGQQLWAKSDAVILWCTRCVWVCDFVWCMVHCHGDLTLSSLSQHGVVLLRFGGFCAQHAWVHAGDVAHRCNTRFSNYQVRKKACILTGVMNNRT